MKSKAMTGTWTCLFHCTRSLKKNSLKDLVNDFKILYNLNILHDLTRILYNLVKFLYYINILENLITILDNLIKKSLTI